MTIIRAKNHKGKLAIGTGETTSRATLAVMMSARRSEAEECELRDLAQVLHDLCEIEKSIGGFEIPEKTFIQVEQGSEHWRVSFR